MHTKLSKGKYKIYHIPGVKIGCTTSIQRRVVEAQGYKPGEYEILFETDNVAEASRVEQELQKDLGYKIDRRPYKDCLLYTSPSPRDGLLSRMPSSA